MQMKDRPIVKLLVRRAGSNRFLRATGRWTKNAEAALNFPSLFHAVHACLLKGLKNVEFIIRFHDDADDRCYCLPTIA